MSDNLGAFLKQRRTDLGLTLRDVERITEARVSNAYLSQLENGGVENPSAIMLHRLSAAYSLDLSDLFSRLEGWDTPAAPPICDACGQVIRNRPTPQQATPTTPAEKADR